MEQNREYEEKIAKFKYREYVRKLQEQILKQGGNIMVTRVDL